MPWMEVPLSKRWKVTVWTLILNFVTFWIAMFLKLDLTAVGVGLAALNAPLYGYLFAETKRPSLTKKEDL